MERTFVLVNPAAGNKKPMKIWSEISAFFDKNNITIVSAFTKGKRDSQEIARKIDLDSFENLIVVGGDGTMNEALNGLMQNEKSLENINLGMIPVGTGNDWGKTHGFTDDYEDSLRSILNFRRIKQDIGLIRYYNGAEKEERYFLNVAGIGYDALVAKKVIEDKERNFGGRFLYMKNLLSGLIEFKAAPCEIQLDDSIILNEELFSLSIGIGKYNGGGMMQLPKADPTDGIFDITLIKPVTKLDIIRQLKNLYDGTFIKHPDVSTYKAEKITVNCSKKLFLETDGEFVGHTPVEITILPRKINVISDFG